MLLAKTTMLYEFFLSLCASKYKGVTYVRCISFVDKGKAKIVIAESCCRSSSAEFFAGAVRLSEEA